ncbi:alpha/beta hydrolase [Methanosarcina sp. WH1]|nr:alpha/beta hydrolase [Methanosarcina sp. WH1]
MLHELGIEHAHVLGCSMGEEITIDFTLEHPEMVLPL